MAATLIVAVDYSSERLPRGKTIHRLSSWLVARIPSLSSFSVHVQWDYGTTKEQFSKYILSSLRKYRSVDLVGYRIVASCNSLGVFDLLSSGKLSLGYCALGDPPTILACRGFAGSLRILDIRNYGDCDYHKAMEIGGFIGQIGQSSYQFESRRKEFLEFECRYSLETLSSLHRVVREFGSGEVTSTISGTSWSMFASSGGISLYNPHQCEEARELESDSFYGGICRAFRRGQTSEPTCILDKNSAYGFSMLHDALPNSLVNYDRSEKDPRAILCADSLWHVARVRIVTEENSYPKRINFKNHDGHEGKITSCHPSTRSQKRHWTYRSGSFVTTLCGQELLQAIENGDVRKVFAHSSYSKSKFISEFVSRLEELRVKYASNQRRLEAKCVKRLYCALYGRFNMHSPAWNADHRIPYHCEYGPFVTIHPDGGWITSARAIAGLNHLPSEPSPRDETLTAVSAAISCSARVNLLDDISKLPDRSIYYCDTDAIHVNNRGKDYLVSRGCVNPVKLGLYKVEREFALAAYFGPKDYRHGDKRVCPVTAFRLRDDETSRAEERTVQTASVMLAKKPNGEVESRKRFVEGYNPFDGYGVDYEGNEFVLRENWDDETCNREASKDFP